MVEVECVIFQLVFMCPVCGVIGLMECMCGRVRNDGDDSRNDTVTSIACRYGSRGLMVITYALYAEGPQFDAGGAQWFCTWSLLRKKKLCGLLCVNRHHRLIGVC